jgi:hypothetical protein
MSIMSKLNSPETDFDAAMSKDRAQLSASHFRTSDRSEVRLPREPSHMSPEGNQIRYRQTNCIEEPIAARDRNPGAAGFTTH